MAILVSGVEGSMTTTEFQRLMKAAGDLQAAHGVANGLVVTKTATARQFSITPGAALAPGALLESGATELRSADANAGSNPRLDLICAQVDSTLPEGTAGSLIIVEGVEAATPALPALTQTAGVLWQEPIAQYQMQGGVVSGLVPFSGTASVQIVLPGSSSWSVPSSSGLTVERRNGVVFFGGRFKRLAAAFADTADFNNEVVIPDGFRPTRQKSVWVTSDAADASTPTTAHMVIQPNGTAALHVFQGTVGLNQTIRAVDTSWIGA